MFLIWKQVSFKNNLREARIYLPKLCAVDDFLNWKAMYLFSNLRSME